MKRALFITQNNFHSKDSGGMQCTARNFDLVSKFYKTDIYITRCKLIEKVLSLLFFYYPAITYKHNKEINELIKKGNYQLVFFDSSIFGNIIKKVRFAHRVDIITFFQNVEYDYSFVRFGNKLRQLLYSSLSWVNEKRALEYSDVKIVLSRRDKSRILDIYKLKTDYIIPITFEDTVKNCRNQELLPTKKPYTLLFVGILNYPNIESVNFFIKKVLPSIDDAEFVIVGKNFEQMKKELEQNSKVKVVGTVDKLDKYYQHADCVVAPIFRGAGMKVKTAEALMFGKTVFGTPEAFAGYRTDITTATVVCDTDRSFIKSINDFLSSNRNTKYNEDSRLLFEKYYSEESAFNVFNEIINHLNYEKKNTY